MKLRGLVMVGAFIGTLIPTVLYFKNQAAFIVQKKILLGVHHSFSQKMRDRLILFAKEQEKMTLTPHMLAQLVKDRFSAVKHVAIQRRSNGAVKLSVMPHGLKARINEEYLLTDSGTLIKVDALQKEWYNGLAQIAVAQKDKVVPDVSQECHKFVSDLSETMASGYRITWDDHNHITLHDKQASRFALLATHETIFSDALLAQYEKLKQEVKDKKLNQRHAWYVDVRFKNQIILFAQKGERV